jgi:hypothetical protein
MNYDNDEGSQAFKSPEYHMVGNDPDVHITIFWYSQRERNANSPGYHFDSGWVVHIDEPGDPLLYELIPSPTHVLNLIRGRVDLDQHPVLLSALDSMPRLGTEGAPEFEGLRRVLRAA